jgi:trimeric autotransporter adhesin
MKNTYTSIFINRRIESLFRQLACLVGIWLMGVQAGQAQIFYNLSDGSVATRGDQFRRVNTNGTSDAQVATNYVNSPGFIAIDRAGNQAFVGESLAATTAKVIAVNLSTGVSSTFVTTPTAASSCGGLAVDPANNYLYYILNDGTFATQNDQLRRINLDGSNDVLIQSGFVSSPGAMVLDAANNRLLIAELATAATRKIFSFNLSTNAITTLTTTASAVAGMALDAPNNKLYYTLTDGSALNANDQLRRINLDGTGDELVVANFLFGASTLALDAPNNRVLAADTRSTFTNIFGIDRTTKAVNFTFSAPTTIGASNAALAGIAVLPPCEPLPLTLSSAPSTTLTCAQPTLTLTATGGPSYTFTGPAGGIVSQNQANGTAIINAPGTYTVAASLAGCESYSTITISQDIAPPTVTVGSAVTLLNCITSAITLTASVGTSYRWDDANNSATRTIIVNTARTYSVTVTGANGCTAVGQRTIGSDFTPAVVSLTATNVCAGQSVTLTATPGLVDYSFTTPTGTVNTGTNNVRLVPGLAAGPYTFTVAARHPTSFCQATATAGATVNAFPTITLTATPSGTLTCDLTSLTISVVSPEANTSYAFSRVGGGGISALATSWARVNAPGTYSVVATNPITSCSSSNTIAIRQDIFPPTVSIAPTSGTLTCAAPSLTLTATTSGTGVRWNDNSTANTLTVNAPGTYSVVATGANGCTATTSVTIGSNTTPPPASIGISPSSTLTCARTSLTLTAQNTLGATYVFSGSSGTLVSSGRTCVVNAPGTYTVVITATNGCTASATTEVFSNTVAPPVFTVTTTPSATLTCALTSLTISVVSPDPNTSYAFRRVGGGGIPSFSPSGGWARVNLSGTYSVSAIDPFTSCFSSTTIAIGQDIAPPTVSISPASGTLTCSVTSLTLTATTSGTGVRWSDNSTGNFLIVSAPGTYSAVATGANGCTAVSSPALIDADIAPPGSPTLAASDSGTLTCSVTSLTLTASATGTGLSYAFSGPSGTLAGSGTTREVSAPGTYTVVITGSNGCTATATTEVFSNTTAPTATLTASPSGTLTCSITSLTLTATGGAPYSFAGPGLSQAGTSSTAVVSQPGTFTVTVTGANGCTATATTVISQSANVPTATLAASGTLTCAATSVTLTASGGNSYAFARAGGGGIISQNATAGTAVVNADGVYSVTVTNTTTGCFSTTTTTVSSNTTAPTATLMASSTAACVPASITLTAGTGSTYAFSGPGLSQSGASATAVVSQSGTFTVVVTGMNGCTATATRSVTFNTPPTAPALSGASLTVSAGTTPLALTTLVTASANHTLTFANSGGVVNPPVANVSTAGVQTFSAVQTSPQGCPSPARVFSLTVISPLPPASQNACRGSNVVMNVLPTGVRYEWYRNGQTIAHRINNVAGVYAGATTASLTVLNAQTSGTFYVKTFAADNSFTWSGPFAVTVVNCGARVAVEAETPLQVRLAPNPLVGGRLRATISGAGGQRLTISLTDMQGRVVREQQWQRAADEQAVDWDVSGQPAGTLLLQATTDRQRQTLRVLTE